MISDGDDEILARKKRWQTRPEYFRTGGGGIVCRIT
jgi:hypothetical protein